MKALFFFAIGLIAGALAVMLTEPEDEIKPLPNVDWQGWTA